MKPSNVRRRCGEFFICLAAGLALLLFQPGLTLADDTLLTPHVLDDTVVTSTGKTKMLDTPASISVITAADLEQMGAKNVMQALERIPGVYNTSASRSSLSIRGTRSSMAGGPVILVDGVSQNYGNYRREELDFIPVSQIEKIEVLRSAGVAYGPGAARGVINIITKKGKGDQPLNASFSVNYGSWDTQNLYGALNGRQNRFDYYLDYSYFDTNGYEEEEETRKGALLKLGYNPTDQIRIGIRGTWLDQDAITAYGLGKFDWHLDNGYRRDIHFPQGDGDPDIVWHNGKEQESTAYALEFSQKGDTLFSNGTLSLTNYEEVYYDTKDTYYSGSGARGDFDNREQDTLTANVSAGYRIFINGIAYTPSLGLNYEKIDFSQRRTYPFDPGRSTAKYDLELDDKAYGIFWDNDFIFNDHWGLKIGNRFDKMELTLEDKQPVKVAADETAWSWVVAPSYHVNPNTNVYVSVSRNHWFPSPQYYFWAQNYPDNDPKDIKPEVNTTYEIGYKQRLSRAMNTSITGYFSKTADKFAGYYDASGTYNGQKNVGDADTYGIEVEIDGRPVQWWGYRLSGAYINAEWKSGQGSIKLHPSNASAIVDLEGYKVHGIPELNGHAGLDFYPSQGLKASVDANISGKYYLDYTNRFTYPSTTTIDASVSYSWDTYKIWLLGKNIFDRDVERAINSDGELTGANGTPKTSYYVQDGRYVELGLRVNF